MDFALTDEQKLLERSVDQVAMRELSRMQGAGVADGAEAWAGCAALGWLAVSLPEACGGIGGAVETMLVMRGFGRALMTAPFLPTVVLGAGLVARLGTPNQIAMLARVIEGGLKLAVAFSEPPDGFDPLHCATTAARGPGGFVLTGRKGTVLGAPEADLLLVPAAMDGGGIGVFLVPPAHPGLAMRPVRLADGRAAADLALDAAAVDASSLLGGSAADPGVLDLVADLAAAAACADAVGAMQEAVRLTIDYLETRKQFSAALSSFQALRHRVVDMRMETEHATSLTEVAAMACDGDDPARRRRLVSAAKARVGKAARFVGEQAVQLHGGIGMTAEHSIGRYHKRLLADDLLFGDRSYHLDRLALEHAT